MRNPNQRKGRPQEYGAASVPCGFAICGGAISLYGWLFRIPGPQEDSRKPSLARPCGLTELDRHQLDSLPGPEVP